MKKATIDWNKQQNMQLSQKQLFYIVFIGPWKSYHCEINEINITSNCYHGERKMIDTHFDKEPSTLRSTLYFFKLLNYLQIFLVVVVTILPAMKYVTSPNSPLTKCKLNNNDIKKLLISLLLLYG